MWLKIKQEFPDLQCCCELWEYRKPLQCWCWVFQFSLLVTLIFNCDLERSRETGDSCGNLLKILYNNSITDFFMCHLYEGMKVFGYLISNICYLEVSQWQYTFSLFYQPWLLVNSKLFQNTVVTHKNSSKIYIRKNYLN